MSSDLSGSGSGSSRSKREACAACKYQRRGCSPNCALAPYFPRCKMQDFLNARRLFGVSNILKTLKILNDSEQKKIALQCMIYQGNAWAHDPVGGCYRIVCRLRDQVQSTEMELQYVKNQIATFRAARAPRPPPVPLQYFGYHQQYQEIQESMQHGPPYQESMQQERGAAILKSELSSSSKSNAFMDLSNAAAGEDVSEDITPFLGGFVVRDSTVFLDSDDHIREIVVLEGDRRPFEHNQEQNIEDGASGSTQANVEEPKS